MILGFEPTKTYTNDDLTTRLGCSPQGGMRRSHETNTLTIVSNHIESIYDDRWDGDVLYYTGMGRQGDQSLTFMQNRTLANHIEEGTRVLHFEVFNTGVYTFVGEMELCREPIEEIQPDEDGRLRKVYVFPLKLIEGVIPTVDKELDNELLEKRVKKVKRKSNKQHIERRAKSASGTPGTRQVTSTSYTRDPYVVAYTLDRANGICELCNNPAPFQKKDGTPYLEVHHIQWLAKGGEDTIANTVALCPNCHKKMHILNLPKDIKSLLQAISPKQVNYNS